MVKANPQNERLKRKYFEYMKEANRKSQATVDMASKAIFQYEQYTKGQDFKTFNKEKAISFKKYLLERKTGKTGQPLSKATVYGILRNLQDFFQWAQRETGYKKIDIRHIEYFNLTDKDCRIAGQKRIKRVPTLEQVEAVLKALPAETEIEKRDRALIAFTALTGIRDSAIASLKLKHIHLEDERIEQLPDEVKTKFSKTIQTYFFPIGDGIKEIVVEWIHFLRKELLFSDEDALFPRTKLSQDKDNSFTPEGLDRTGWSTAGPIRKIFKAAFEQAGLEYCPPHSFRSMLARFGEKVCRTPEQFKGWSQNLGHEHVMTTFNSYGEVSCHRQGEIIKDLGKPQFDDSKIKKLMLEALSEAGIKK